MNLADILRPKTFEDIVGQGHLTSKNCPLMKLIKSGSFDSLIFVGSPGTGKTSMAKLIGESLHMEFYQLHGAMTGISDLKLIADKATKGIQTLVFIDEIHRYNKSQQDLLLKLIDDRHIKIVGASTENPYYSLIPALRSRSLIFKFKPVSKLYLKTLADRVKEHFKKVLDVEDVDMSTVLDDIILDSNGDVRRFLNILELAFLIADRKDNKLILSISGLSEIISGKGYNEDEYWDLFSGMIKSIRGSDPDGALLWGIKLIKNGVPPEAIYRRLMISASEDIGNAYPDAVIFVSSSYNSFINVGTPEGLIILAQCIVFLSTCPKSNRSYIAYKDIDSYLNNNDPKVPINVTNREKSLYKYPFDYGGFVKQEYLPKGLQFYYPLDNGFEIKIKERLKLLWGDNKKYE